MQATDLFLNMATGCFPCSHCDYFMGVKVVLMNNATPAKIFLLNIGPHRGRGYNVSLKKLTDIIMRETEQQN